MGLMLFGLSPQKIVPPVLNSFTDQDSRVRYYACEALYNIAKVLNRLKSAIFLNFSPNAKDTNLDVLIFFSRSETDRKLLLCRFLGVTL